MTNPDFHLFSITSNAVLSAIVKGELDPVLAAKRELANRGFDADGKWVGFKAAKEIHGLTA